MKGCNSFKRDSGVEYNCCVNCHTEESDFMVVTFRMEVYTVCCHVPSFGDAA